MSRGDSSTERHDRRLVPLVHELPQATVGDMPAALLPLALDRMYVSTRCPNGVQDLTPAEVFNSDDDRAASLAIPLACRAAMGRPKTQEM
jgi:hypothetical protein